MMSAYRMMFAYLYYVCLPVLCLLNCMLSAYLYYVWLVATFTNLTICVSYYLCVLLSVWCLPFCMMSAKYDVCIYVFFLLPV